MLAALRRRALLSVPRASASISSTANGSITEILAQEAAKKTAPTSSTTKTAFPVYRVLTAGKPLLPNSLTYKNALLKPKTYKKPSVAPPPSVTRQTDTFHQLDLDPRHFTNNSAVLAHFVTEMGKIKSRDQTKLTAKSQRLVGRTIRRAKMMGIIPILSKAGFKRYH